jgi:hypothetical protein
MKQVIGGILKTLEVISKEHAKTLSLILRNNPFKYFAEV